LHPGELEKNKDLQNGGGNFSDFSATSRQKRIFTPGKSFSAFSAGFGVKRGVHVLMGDGNAF